MPNVRCCSTPGRATCASCATRCSVPPCCRASSSGRLRWDWHRQPMAEPRRRTATSPTARRSRPRCSGPAACWRRPRPNWACRGRRGTGAWTATASRAAESMRILRVLPLAIRMIGLMVMAVAAATALTAVLVAWLPPWLAALSSALATGTLAGIVVWRTFVPLRALIRALTGTVAGYRDGDFSFGITWDRYGDLIELVDAHNALGQALREQRLSLVQRELLLDTMVQNTPVAMLLLDPARRVVLGNLAARKMLGDGRRLEGHGLDDLLARAPAAVAEAFARGGDGMFTVGKEDQEDIYHLAR